MKFAIYRVSHQLVGRIKFAIHDQGERNAIMGHPVHEQVFFIIEINKCVTMLGLFSTTLALGCAIKDLRGFCANS
jgi:hypothetical protein